MIKKIILGALLCVFSCAFCFLFTSNVSYASEINQGDYILCFEKYEFDQSETLIKVVFENETQSVENGYFIPQKHGDYFIHYTNSILVLHAYTVLPSFDFSFDATLNEKYSINEIILLPKLTVESTVPVPTKYSIVITRNGVNYASYLTDQEVQFKANEAGTFEVFYFFENVFGYLNNYSFKLEVESKKTLVNPVLPKFAYFNTKIEIENAYGFFEGVFYQATTTITSPAGISSIKNNNLFKPSEIGLYTFHYRTDIGGNVIEKTDELDVVSSNTGLFSINSSVKKSTDNADTPSYAVNQEKGVEFLFNDTNAAIVYNNIIDLSQLSSSQNLISFQPLQSDSYIGFREIYVQLIDAYDPTNVVNVFWWKVPYAGVTYASFMLADSGNGYYGRINDGAGEGLRDLFGTITYGVTMEGYANQSSYPFTIQYDYTTNSLFMVDEKGQFLVYDLDDDVADLENNWKGFTNNEIYLKLYFPYSADPSGVNITEIAGMKLDSPQMVADNYNNFININIEKEFQNDMPSAFVGYSYPIPSVLNNDYLLGKYEYTTKLYQMISSQKLDISNVLGNGVFTPQVAGNYLIEYSATNIYGQSVKKELSFVAKETYVENTVSLSSSLPIVMGQKYRLPDLLISGGSGVEDVALNIQYNGKAIYLDSNGCVFLNEIGKIEMEVKITDYIGVEKTFHFTLAIIPENPFFMFESTVPLSVKKGAILTFPDFSVIDATKEESAAGYYMDKKIFINGIEQSSFSFDTTNFSGDVIELKYFAYYGTKTFEKKYFIKVIKNPISIKDFLIFDQTAVSVQTSVLYSSFSMSNDQKIVSPNYLVADNLAFNFLLDTSNLNFSSVEIILTDSLNENIKVKLNISKGNSTISIFNISNSAVDFRVPGSFLSEYDNLFEFYYDAESNSIKNNLNKSICTINFCENGDVFEGFLSDYVSVSIGLVGVTKLSKLNIISISNQSFSLSGYILSDITAPKISVLGAIQTSNQLINTDLVIPKSVASDFINGKCDVFVKILDPDGNVVVNNYNIKENHTIRLQKFGFYQITYSSYDDSNNSANVNFYVQVRNNVPPTIGNIVLKTKYNLNEKITIPTIVVNGESSDSYYMYVVDINLTKIILKNNEFVCNEKGAFTLVIFVFDEFNNYTRAEYFFEVV